ncbi:MAG: transposase [Trichodesmium sp. MO_231.B1]|nr:transposase [Trichodesmium sp. MO_231.B1]
MNKYPEFQFIKHAYFVTFVTWERLELTPEAREIVLNSFLFFHQQRYQIFSVVIMPDHVHSLIVPFLKKESEYWSIGSILHSIKGYSAKEIPKIMNHIGKLWQDGRHERLIKSQKEMIDVWKYIRQNPVKAELVNQPEEYPFFLGIRQKFIPIFSE